MNKDTIAKILAAMAASQQEQGGEVSEEEQQAQHDEIRKTCKVFGTTAHGEAEYRAEDPQVLEYILKNNNDLTLQGIAGVRKELERDQADLAEMRKQLADTVLPDAEELAEMEADRAHTFPRFKLDAEYVGIRLGDCFVVCNEDAVNVRPHCCAPALSATGYLLEINFRTDVRRIHIFNRTTAEEIRAVIRAVMGDEIANKVELMPCAEALNYYERRLESRLAAIKAIQEYYSTPRSAIQ